MWPPTAVSVLILQEDDQPPPRVMNLWAYRRMPRSFCVRSSDIPPSATCLGFPPRLSSFACRKYLLHLAVSGIEKLLPISLSIAEYLRSCSHCAATIISSRPGSSVLDGVRFGLLILFHRNPQLAFLLLALRISLTELPYEIARRQYKQQKT